MNTFCTIITSDHFPKAIALYKSLIKFNVNMQLQVLVADDKPLPESVKKFTGIKCTGVVSLSSYPMVNTLYQKYAHIDIDFFRWSMKSVFISYLLENGFDKVLYADCDMFFFNNYNFLFIELEKSPILLNPHWKNTNPLIDKDSFLSLFTSGIYSAGFIGASKKGISIMKWWANACHFMMGAKINIGIHDDQKYLDLVPVIAEDTCIIRHRGCNIGAWNYEECKRLLINNTVLINGKYPIIFIHFDEMMAKGILQGYDKLLLPYLNEYRQSFIEEGYNLSTFLNKLPHYTNASVLVKSKWYLRIRTRIKKVLYKLAESL